MDNGSLLAFFFAPVGLGVLIGGAGAAVLLVFGAGIGFNAMIGAVIKHIGKASRTWNER